MIEIRYCGVCGDRVIVDKMEDQLSDLGEVQTVECGSCNLSVRAEDEEIFNEEEDVLDLTGVYESAKDAINA